MIRGRRVKDASHALFAGHAEPHRWHDRPRSRAAHGHLLRCAGHWAHQEPPELWLSLALLQKYLGAKYDDIRRMGIALWESSTHWTSVRAPRIQPSATKGGY